MTPDERTGAWLARIEAADCTCTPWRPSTPWHRFRHEGQCPTYAAVWGLPPWEERMDMLVRQAMESLDAVLAELLP